MLFYELRPAEERPTMHLSRGQGREAKKMGFRTLLENSDRKRGEKGEGRERGKGEEKERGEGKRREERERESERLHARVRSHQVIDKTLDLSLIHI